MKEKILKLSVSEIMNRDVFAIGPAHSWKDAARKLSAKNIHHLVVVDENHRPVTVISSFDFLRFALDDSMDADAIVSDIAGNKKLYSVQAGKTILDALNEMNNHHVECVVVLDDAGRLAGIITSKDLMNAIYTELYRT